MAETDLHALLAGMTPTLHPEEYVFCCLPPGAAMPDGIVSFATVREDEGVTVVLEREHTNGLTCSAPFRAITLAAVWLIRSFESLENAQRVIRSNCQHEDVIVAIAGEDVGRNPVVGQGAGDGGDEARRVEA